MIEINLLPGGGNKRRRTSGTGTAAFNPRAWFAGIGEKITDKFLLGGVGAAALSIAVIAVLFVSQATRASSLEEKEMKAIKDSTQFSAVLNAKSKAEAARDSLYQQIAIIKSIDDTRYLWSHLMYEISNALPQYTWLKEITQTSAPKSVAAADTTKRTPTDTATSGKAKADRDRALKAPLRFAARPGEGDQVPAGRTHCRHPGAHTLHEIARGLAVHPERAAHEIGSGSERRQGSDGVLARSGNAGASGVAIKTVPLIVSAVR